MSARVLEGGGLMRSPWIAALRVPTLAAAVVPVAVGTACAHALGAASLLPALAALWGALFIQIGTNFANDVFDAARGADGPDRLGPPRPVATGAIDARAMSRAMWGAFALAALAGLYLTDVAGWPVLVLGVASIASGIAYTGGPYPLAYHGLGDLFVMLFFGFAAVAGTTYVQVGALSPLALGAAVPIGALTTAILVVNNLRDRVTDARVGKRTLAVRLGRRTTIAEYVGLLALAYATPVVLLTLDLAGPTVLAPLLTLPLGLFVAQRVATRSGRPLNRALALTAGLLFAYGALFTLGLVVGAPR